VLRHRGVALSAHLGGDGSLLMAEQSVSLEEVARTKSLRDNSDSPLRPTTGAAGRRAKQ